MSSLPIAVIGAGPVGLAAAANLIERGLQPIIFEAGARVGSSVWSWAHVKLFTPWSFLIDPASRRLLEAEGGWPAPDEQLVPLGKQLVERYLDPLAEVMSDAVRLNHRVLSVSRVGHDRMTDGDRHDAPFLIVVDTPDGRRRFTASAVIDASGTWTTPNPMGAGGVDADGEREHQAHIRYGMPDVLQTCRERYAGRRILVVGSGHSAIGNLLSLVKLAREVPNTSLAWAIRRDDPSRLWGGSTDDDLTERGALGRSVYDAVRSGHVTLLTGMSISAVRTHPHGLAIVDVHGADRIVVDEIIVATGSRPDLGMLRELRLELDLATESTRTLGPLIDPNHHSCGSVPAHGAAELEHPERDFYVVGMKSYGRAPTFLLRTGYEQVRSVVAALAGDSEAAARVELVLPQTGVCSTDLGADGPPTRAACC